MPREKPPAPGGTYPPTRREGRNQVTGQAAEE